MPGKSTIASRLQSSSCAHDVRTRRCTINRPADLRNGPLYLVKSSSEGGHVGARRLLLIEFNELSPSLLDEFMRSGLLPNFSRFYSDSVVFTTDAAEEPP